MQPPDFSLMWVWVKIKPPEIGPHACFSLWFHLPGFHFGDAFLTTTAMFRAAHRDAFGLTTNSSRLKEISGIPETVELCFGFPRAGNSFPNTIDPENLSKPKQIISLVNGWPERPSKPMEPIFLTRKRVVRGFHRFLPLQAVGSF